MRHEIWVIDDAAAVAAVTAAVGESPVVVADGHHRFETAIAYRRERRAGGDAPGGYDFVMALIVELSEDQLSVGPIHRALSGLPEGTDVVAAFAKWFEVLKAGSPEERTVRALGDAGTLALLTPDAAWLLIPRPEAYEKAGSDLDSSLVALALDELPDHQNLHQHSWSEAVGTLRAGRAQAVVLLRPVSVAQIAEWAEDRRRMPPKTTYFSPKPRTGMVFRVLEP